LLRLISEKALGAFHRQVFATLKPCRTPGPLIGDGLKKYLGLARTLAWTRPPRGNSLTGSMPPFVLAPEFKAVVDHATLVDYGLSCFMDSQGNVRGLDADASVEKYRERIDQYTTAEFSLDENRIYILVSQLNADNAALAGVAPILLDPALQRAHPEDTRILAEQYYPIVKKRLERKQGLNQDAPSYEKSPLDIVRELMDKLESMYELK